MTGGERSLVEPADAVLAADLHLTARVPRCRRADEWFDSMWAKLAALAALREANGRCPILVAGDVVGGREPRGGWEQPAWFIRELIERIDGWICVPGQHDLPAHSEDEYGRSVLSVLEAAGRVRVLRPGVQARCVAVGSYRVFGFPLGSAELRLPPGTRFRPGSTNVALVHRFVYQGRPPFPGAEEAGGSAEELARGSAGFDLFVSGDNHETFVADVGDGLLVNPGCVMRASAAEAGHEPCAFLWWALDRRTERAVLPHDPGAVRTDHLEEGGPPSEGERARASELAVLLRASLVRGASFSDALRRYVELRKPDQKVVDMIHEALEKGRGGGR